MKPGVSVYRDPGDGLRARREELVRARAAEVEQVPLPVRVVYRRRVGRVWAGRILVLSTVVLVGAMVTGANELVWILWGSWAAAALAYGVAFGLADTVWRTRLRRALAGTGVVEDDIARLESHQPVRWLVELAERLEERSATWLMAGVALLAPLTLHSGVAVLASGSVPGSRFDSWMRVSGVLVGHSHIILAWLCCRAIRRGDAGYRFGEGWSALGWTVASSLVPGMFMMFIPVVVVAATGLVFIPVLFAQTRRRLLVERQTVAFHVEQVV
jgi:hypothetical protein